MYPEQVLQCHVHKQMYLPTIENISPGGVVVSAEAVPVHPSPCY